MRRILPAIITGGLLLAATATSFATAAPATAPAFTSASSFSHWLIRARGIAIMPTNSSNQVGNLGGSVSTSNQIVPELDFSYFFTKNISAELILATSRNSVTAVNTSAGTLSLGKVSVLPPTLTLQYHFLADSLISPYVGAGLNYTYFYDVKNGSGLSGTYYAPSFGPALQVGTDVNLNKHWVFNVDVKKIYITTHVSTVSSGTQQTTDASLNPWVVGCGFGYRF